jgi:hypothetical protein
MLVRQHAGALAPMQQQVQLPRHLQQCTCFPALLRRPQLAAGIQPRQHSTGPNRTLCSAVAAPPAEQVDTVEGPSLDSATSGRRAVTAPAFPFVRIAGQGDMRLALLLNVIDPRIGGVLIMGDRGTGKSVAVSGTTPRMAAPECAAKHDQARWQYRTLCRRMLQCMRPMQMRPCRAGGPHCPASWIRCARW